MPSIEELRGLGFAIVLYANAALQATILAVQDVLGHLRRTGSLAEIEDRLGELFGAAAHRGQGCVRRARGSLCDAPANAVVWER
jgi:2-methylisocitrate lyase-like PEP mutase family enzyme